MIEDCRYVLIPVYKKGEKNKPLYFHTLTGIGESEIAMKLDIYVCETRRCVMWLIEHGYPIFDQKIKRGKTQVKYRFYFDEIEGIEE